MSTTDKVPSGSDNVEVVDGPARPSFAPSKVVRWHVHRQWLPYFITWVLSTYSLRDAIFSHLLALYFSSWWSWLIEDRCRRGMSSSLWSWAPLKGGPCLPNWQSPLACQTSNRQVVQFLSPTFQASQFSFTLSPSLLLDLSTHPSTSNFEQKLFGFNYRPNKSSQLATEVSCMGFTRATVVKGYVGFKPPFVGRDRSQMKQGST